MTLYTQFLKVRVPKGTTTEIKIELYYSIFSLLAGNKRWFCRIWVGYEHAYSYSNSKFNAYRQAYKEIQHLIK